MSSIADHPRMAEQAAEILKGLAHPIRIRIIASLCQEGTLHVKGMAQRIDATQASVSQQLRILRMLNLVAPERRGGFVWYRLAEPNLKKLMTCLEGCQKH